jgi:putative ABC transport system substrate-binding protein
MHRRRALIALLGMSTFPHFSAARPQRAARLGILANVPPSDPGAAPIWRAFYVELKARGWQEGRNLAIWARYGGGQAGNYPGFAGDLVSARPDVLLATSSQAVDALRKATRSIPIVMTNMSHAVEPGYVSSLAHPGGNITGVTIEISDVGAKAFELLLSIRPDTKKIGLLWSPNNPSSALGFAGNGVVTRGLELISLPVNAANEIGPALARAKRERIQALFVHPAPAIFTGYRQIVGWAKANRVITVSISHTLARLGFLLSYGADVPDMFRTTAIFVDRILRGARPADLPVEQPTKFDLIINLKTAEALGVTIPPSLLARADEVIQ